MIWTVVFVYLWSGLLVVSFLMWRSAQARRNLTTATGETQTTLLDQGIPVGVRISKIVLALALWVFWPAAVYGVVEQRMNDIKERKGQAKEQ